MRLFEYTREKDNQYGVTLIALTFTIVLLLILSGITLSITAGDESLLKKTEQDTNKYNQQVEKYKEEYKGLTERVDGEKNRIDSMPEDF